MWSISKTNKYRENFHNLHFFIPTSIPQKYYVQALSIIKKEKPKDETTYTPEVEEIKDWITSVNTR